MPYVLNEPVRVGISACCFGAQVRWNRKGWDKIAVLGREKDDFIWAPICPEVMAGLGVPRPPIRLVGGDGNAIWNGTGKIKNRLGQDLTGPLKQGMLASEAMLEKSGIDAYVFMEGSPTCGVYRTTLKNKRLGKPPGAFGSLLLSKGYFLIPAQDLESPIRWWDWRRRLHAFVWLKRKDIGTKAELYEVWHRFKFVCQEVDRAGANAIGKRLATLPERLDVKTVSDFKSDTLNLLRKPSTLKRIQQMMAKHYAHYRKHFDNADASVRVPKTQQAQAAFVAELIKMEHRAVNENYDFAGTPVIAKIDRRAGSRRR